MVRRTAGCYAEIYATRGTSALLYLSPATANVHRAAMKHRLWGKRLFWNGVTCVLEAKGNTIAAGVHAWNEARKDNGKIVEAMANTHRG